MSVLKQLCLIFAICLGSECISAVLPFTLPASVISMVILLLLLLVKAVKPAQLKEVSDFMLGNMALFFIPVVSGVIRYKDVLFANFWAIILICVLTTPLVFFVTGHVVQLTVRLMKKKEGKQHD
ncbi:MAG: CidA/LrgA family protein [Oscillospiraceae bacterium]|nr:CidA/LrgA family protein [Oscillospiraceae bacterium]